MLNLKNPVTTFIPFHKHIEMYFKLNYKKEKYKNWNNFRRSIQTFKIIMNTASKTTKSEYVTKAYGKKMLKIQ